MVSIRDKVVCGPEEAYIPAHLSYGQFLFDQFVKGGDRVALISAETGESVTFRHVLQESVNVATSLRRLGVGRGDVVAVSSENRSEFMSAILAVLFTGATVAPLNITYTPGEISHMLNITKPKYIFCSPLTSTNIHECCQELPFVKSIILFGEFEMVPAVMFAELAKEPVEVATFVPTDVRGAEDAAAVMCSSGTTGLPKGVLLTHVNLLTLSRHMYYYLVTSKGLDQSAVKTFLTVIPWFHAYGLVTTLSVLSINVEVVFLVRFEEKQFLETVQNYKVNMVTIVPPLAVFLAKHPLVPQYRLDSLREVWCGAAPLSAEIQRDVATRTGLSGIRQGYGLTEVTMACCVDISGDQQKVGSCGTPAPGMRVKVVDIDSGKKLGPNESGELWIKSPLRMKGYMGNMAESDALVDAEGYIQTGDVGYYDSDGSFFIIDRLKELIKYNGFQVPPAELEALLLQHPVVAECAVVGTPHETAGELPTAFVVVRAGVPPTPDTASTLVDYIAGKVSSAKRLRGGVIFVEQIPKNASGKILRRELRAMLPSAAKSKL